MLFVVITLNSELRMPATIGCLVLASMLFWLMLLSYLVLFKSEKAKKRTGSRSNHQKAKRFRRRSLPFFLVLSCRRRQHNAPSYTTTISGQQITMRCYTPQDRQHNRWRRRQRKSKCRAKERRAQYHDKFLTPRRSSNALWNSRRVADLRFFSEPNMDNFAPHSVFGVVPEEVLDSFVEEHADAFLSATQLKNKLESADRTRSAEEVVQNM